MGFILPLEKLLIYILVLVDIVVLHISHYTVEYFDNHFHSYAIITLC